MFVNPDTIQTPVGTDTNLTAWATQIVDNDEELWRAANQRCIHWEPSLNLINDLGDGRYQAMYHRLGYEVTAWATYEVAANTTYNPAAFLTPPITPRALTDIGDLLLRQGATGAVRTGKIYTGPTAIANLITYDSPAFNPQTTSPVDQTTPWIWAAGDLIQIYLNYESAIPFAPGQLAP